MHGNVWEWCADRFGTYSPEAQTDPTGPAEGAGRVLRGGSWGGDGGFCRSAGRSGHVPGYRYVLFGLRLAPGQGSASTQPVKPGGQEGKAQMRFRVFKAFASSPEPGEEALNSSCGKSRLERYGEVFLGALKHAFAAGPASGDEANARRA